MIDKNSNDNIFVHIIITLILVAAAAVMDKLVEG
jgi:hypothetical protein